MKEYVPSVLTLVLFGFEVYLSYSFASTNFRTGSTVFGLSTVFVSVLAALFGLVGFLSTSNFFKHKFMQRGYSEGVYRGLLVAVVVLSLALMLAAIVSGSADYTQFQTAVN